MTTQNAQLFIAKLKDQAFQDTFGAATAAGRQELLNKAGLTIPLAEAEALYQETTGEIGDEDLGKAVGGGAGIYRPKP